MMNEAEIKAAALDKLFAGDPDAASDEDSSKDAFFVQVAQLAEAMIARHGKEFAMGTLILSARFIAEGKPLIKRSAEAGARSSTTQ